MNTDILLLSADFNEKVWAQIGTPRGDVSKILSVS